MTGKKCAIPQHRRTLKIYSPADNRYINRGQCQDHLKNGVVTYSGTYRDTAEPILIINLNLKKKFFKPKCTLKCKSGSENECVSQNSSDVTDGIKEKIRLLNNLTHENLLGFKSVIIDEKENCENIYIIRDVDKNSTSAKSISNTTKWTYEALGNAIASIVKAIQYLHQNNIAHGHLKSSSIFVNVQNVWKVADYFLIPYLHYLSQKTITSCFVPNKKADLKAIAQFIESSGVQSGALKDFIKLCKVSNDIDEVITDTLFEKISKFSRLEAEFKIGSDSYIGEGSSGDVLKVKSYIDKQVYAIKRVKLDSKSNRDFNHAKKETHALSKLKHTNIVQYHTSWTEIVDEPIFNSYKPINNNQMDVDDYNDNGCQTVGVLYIMMELCNKNLSSVINEGKLRGNAELIHRYSVQILEGLIYMHSQGVIHSDLHTDNILLSYDDEIKISDFGLTTTTKSVLERYRSGDGSLIHIAPELMDKNTRSRNVDMFSFGIVLFEMLFKPFQNHKDLNDLLNMIQQTEDPIPDKYIHHPIYHVLIEIIKAVLNKEARKRLQAKAVLQLLSSPNIFGSNDELIIET